MSCKSKLHGEVAFLGAKMVLEAHEKSTTEVVSRGLCARCKNRVLGEYCMCPAFYDNFNKLQVGNIIYHARLN